MVTIGVSAFEGCTKLKTVDKNAFKDIDKKAVIKVPKGKAAAYKKLINNKKVTVK